MYIHAKTNYPCVKTPVVIRRGLAQHKFAHKSSQYGSDWASAMAAAPPHVCWTITQCHESLSFCVAQLDVRISPPRPHVSEIAMDRAPDVTISDPIAKIH